MHYDLERAIFSVATEALLSLPEQNVSGVDALKAAMAVRKPQIYIERMIRNDPEAAEYLTRLGSFVELAASLPRPVDQQG